MSGSGHLKGISFMTEDRAGQMSEETARCLGPIAVELDLLIHLHLQGGSLEWDYGPRSQLMNVCGLQLETSKPMPGLR